MSNEVTGVIPAEKTKRISVARNIFITAWMESTSAKEVADKTGLEVNSCLARASKYRSEGFPLKNMQKGGGAKLNPEDALQLIADLRGVSIDVVRKEGAVLKAAAVQRAADKAAG